jgi:hypothetical protein
MAEWSKAHAWKVCIRQKCIMGSNPILSALDQEIHSCHGAFQEILRVNKVIMLLNKAWFSKFMTVFGYVMAVIYVGLGIALFWKGAFPYVPKNFKFAFALFFIAYGFYRLVKMRSKVNESND